MYSPTLPPEIKLTKTELVHQKILAIERLRDGPLYVLNTYLYDKSQFFDSCSAKLSGGDRTSFMTTRRNDSKRVFQNRIVVFSQSVIMNEPKLHVHCSSIFENNDLKSANFHFRYFKVKCNWCMMLILQLTTLQKLERFLSKEWNALTSKDYKCVFCCSLTIVELMHILKLNSFATMTQPYCMSG